MERYNTRRRISSGGYGEVSLCRDTLTNTNVAVKWIPFDVKIHGLPCLVLREIAVLKELNHVNVVRLLDVVDEEDGINLVFEYMYTDLGRFIYSPAKRTREELSHQIKNILFQILEGVSYCHSQKVIHRDLKPHNLLLDGERKTVKLADFGFARTTDVPLLEYSTDVATVPYRAPELLLAAPYSSAVDVWSVGCIFAEMVIRKPLFDGVIDTAVLKSIIRIFGLPKAREWREVESYIRNFFGRPTSFPTEASQDLASVVPGLEPEGLDLLTKMLCIYPNKRITAYDALQHPYLRGISTEQIQSTVSTRRKDDCCTVV